MSSNAASAVRLFFQKPSEPDVLSKAIIEA
jgi:hypothetical protein